MGRLLRRLEGAVNKAVEKNVLGGDAGEVGELRAMGGVRGFFKEVHAAAKENRDFGAPKKDEPPWGNPNISGHQFKDVSPSHYGNVPMTPPSKAVSRVKGRLVLGKEEEPPW